MSTAIHIEEVSGKAGRRRFVQFQFELYRRDPLWVPPLIRDEMKSLDPESNPGLEGCELRLWLAVREGKCVGRIAGVINHRDNQIRAVRAARFCLLDFVDDVEVVRRLLGAAESWAADRGMSVLEGPLGLATFERSAVLVEGFDHLPTVVSSYNFPYYGTHIEASGFEKEIDYLEHRFRLPRELDQKYAKIARYVLQKKRVRLLQNQSLRELLAISQEIFQLVNEAYSGLFEFTPMSEAEINAIIKRFALFIDPAFVKLIVDRDGAVVAFGFAMPSLSRLMRRLRGKLWRIILAGPGRVRRSDTLDLYLVAVRPALQNAGLHTILMHEMHKQALGAGLQWVETNGELETNSRVLRMWKDIDHETHKRRRIYSKPIGVETAGSSPNTGY